jgi:CO/xanthine dehydrogenase Mo-binding subunit
VTAVGTSIRRVDGPAKVSGSAQYTADIHLPGTLYMRVLRSPYAHARVASIDASRAAALPGVVVLTRDDLADMDPYYGPVVRDQPIVAIDKVRFVGDVVAAVATERRDLAEEALDLIEVEYEELPSAVDPVLAMEPSAPVIHEGRRTPDVQFVDMRSVHFQLNSNVCSVYHVSDGDVEAGFAEADEIFEDTYTTPMIQHGHIEPHATIGYWDVQGKLTVHSSTQNPSVIRTQLAELYGRPENMVRVTAPHVGAGYGAKTYPKLEPLVAAMARKARRPVQWVLSREEVFLTSVRHAAVVTIKTGVKRDGTIIARRVSTIYDTGAYADIGPRTAKNGGYVSGGPYRIPNIDLTSYCVYTNKPPAGAFRGFGVPQVCWAYESQMDDIARRLGIDPVELRLKNMVQEGDTFVTGDTLVSVGISECLRQAAEAIGWKGTEAASAIATDRPGIVRGKGIACMIKSTMTPSNSAASVRLNADGSAQLLTSSVEIGQGTTTSLAQIVADAIGIEVGRVSVTLPDTDVTPYDQSTSSSRTTFSMGHAAHEAGIRIREQLLEAAASELEISPGDLEIAGGTIQVKGAPQRSMTIPEVFSGIFGTPVGSLFGAFDFQTPGGLDPDTGKGRASAFWFLSAAAAEVEVDTETGKVRVLEMVTAVDVGKAINPLQCHLQNEGSMLTALGSALFEEMAFERGQPINASFVEYMLPSLEDSPHRFTSLLVETPHPDGPFGAKGVGEAAIGPVAPAIGNAVANALGGIRIRHLPIRPDRVVDALDEANR